MNTFLIHSILLPGLQLGILLALSPFINGIMKKIKALLQGREGPPWLQGYYDLLKYFRKETVISHETSWIFLATPPVVFASVCVAALVVPAFIPVSLLPSLGGLVLLVYLFGLGRFFTVSAAMEPGSGFAGMASSREMMLSCLIEPVMLLAVFVLVILSGTTDLFEMINQFSRQQFICLNPSYLLAFVALFIAAIAEMGRVPFDNPETHYELTMVHEGLLLEYSGKQLGTMFWAAWTKQLLLLSLLANLLSPWTISAHWRLENLGMELLLYLMKVLFLCILVAMVETVVAKARLFRIKDILGASFVLALIALILTAQQIGLKGPVSP